MLDLMGTKQLLNDNSVIPMVKTMLYRKDRAVLPTLR